MDGWMDGWMDGLRYRFIAVQSSVLDERKKKRLERLIESELREFSKAATEESERSYSCLEDAERGAAELTKGLKGYHTIEVSTHEEMEVLKRTTRGRPRKDDPAPTRKVFRNHVIIHDPNPEALEEARRVASMFVLITNVLDEQAMSNVDVLQAYKEQMLGIVWSMLSRYTSNSHRAAVWPLQFNVTPIDQRSGTLLQAFGRSAADFVVRTRGTVAIQWRPALEARLAR